MMIIKIDEKDVEGMSWMLLCVYGWMVEMYTFHT